MSDSGSCQAFFFACFKLLENIPFPEILKYSPSENIRLDIWTTKCYPSIRIQDVVKEGRIL
jgi:hypothetical protein